MKWYHFVFVVLLMLCAIEMGNLVAQKEISFSNLLTPVPTSQPIPMHTYPIQDYPNTHRVTDQEAGVVCWIVEENQGVGISCLPIKDTLLAGGAK
jgi:hypothetical protein